MQKKNLVIFMHDLTTATYTVTMNQAWSMTRRMKRFVSYLYSTYNNQKIHNAGFARVELRSGRNRIDIHLKENGYSGKVGTVYLFVRNQKNIHGIPIGKITFHGSQADFRYEQPEENVGQTPFHITQMNGILIMMDEQAAFLSQWDEEPVDTASFTVWNGEQDQQQSPDTGLEHGNQAETLHAGREHGNSAEKETADQKNEIRTENASDPVNANPNQQTASCTESADLANSSHTETPDDPAQTESLESQQQDAAGREYQMSDAIDTLQQPCEQEHVNSDIQTAELQPQRQPGEMKWEQTWRYMLRTYPVIHEFEDNNHVLCVRIEIKDVRLLPEKYWSMVNNSFLLHGFFNYRYIVFGRIEQSWFVGIPGIYQNQEHVMASIFGFPDFLPKKQKNERGEQPGYWYRMLEI